MKYVLWFAPNVHAEVARIYAYRVAAYQRITLAVESQVECHFSVKPGFFPELKMICRSQ